MVEMEAFGALLPPDRRRQTLKISRQTTVREIIESLGLDPDEIGFVTIDGVQHESGDTVPPECRLCIFPHLSGG